MKELNECETTIIAGAGLPAVYFQIMTGVVFLGGLNALNDFGPGLGKGLYDGLHG